MKCPVPEPESLVDEVSAAAAPRLLLLTGERNAGKTRWCGRACDAARAAGLDVAGLISPPVYAGNDRVGIDLLNAATGERRQLARRPPPGEAGTAGLHWRFDARTLAWGNAVMRSIRACDLLFVDELGPLEFRGDGGFLAAFDAIAARRYRLAVAVIRPSLLETACARWPWRHRIYDQE